MPIPSRFAKPPFSARKGGFAEPAYSARKWVCFRPLSRLGSLLTPPNSGRKRGVWPTHDLGSKRRVLKLCSCWTQTTHRKDLVMCQNLMQDFQPVGPDSEKEHIQFKGHFGTTRKIRNTWTNPTLTKHTNESTNFHIFVHFFPDFFVTDACPMDTLHDIFAASLLFGLGCVFGPSFARFRKREKNQADKSLE